MELLQATLYNSGWMDHCQVCLGCFTAIPVLDSLDDKKAYLSLNHVITVYNDMFNHMDGVMWALANRKTQWKEDLYCIVTFVWQKLSKYYDEVTPTTGMLLISAHIRYPFRKLQSCRKWDKGMDINPEDETSYTTHYQKTFIKYGKNEHCIIHKCLPVTKPESVLHNNLVSSAMVSKSVQALYDPYDLSSNDEEYLMPKNVAETKPGQSDCAACWLTATRLNVNSPPEVPHNWGHIDPNLNNYHCSPMEISSTLLLADITVWRCQQEETHSMYANLFNVAYGILSIIPHCVEVKGDFPFGEKWWGGDSQQPQARLFTKCFEQGKSLEAITDRCLAITHDRIQPVLNMTWWWRERWSKGRCPEWLRSTTFWKCSRVVKTYVLHRTNLVLKTSWWQL